MDEDSTPSPCRQCAALQAELVAVKAERDALASELRERRETTAAFLALLEKRQRQAREREYDPDPGSSKRGGTTSLH